MNKHHKALELDKILAMLAKECACEDAREQALLIEPLCGKFEIEEALRQTSDAYMLSGRFGAPSFGGIKNMSGAFRRAEAGNFRFVRTVFVSASWLELVQLRSCVAPFD